MMNPAAPLGGGAPAAVPQRLDNTYLNLIQTEFQLEHDATWKTLDAAAAQRDLVTKFHGGLILFLGVLLPVLAGNLGIEASLIAGIIILDVAILLVVFLSYYILVGVQEFRMLQFLQDASCKYSRYILAGSQRQATFFDTRSFAVPSLSDQHDPMGMVVTTTRHFFFADVFAAAMLATITIAGFIVYAVTGFRSMRQSLPAAPIGLAIGGLLVGGLATHLVRRRIDRMIRLSEAATSRAIEKRYRELGLVPHSVAQTEPAPDPA